MFIEMTRRRDTKTITVNTNQIGYILDFEDGVTAVYFAGGDNEGLHRVLVNERYEELAALLLRNGR